MSDGLREALSEAMDNAETAAEPVAAPAPLDAPQLDADEAPAEAAETAAAKEARDELGRFQGRGSKTPTPKVVTPTATKAPVAAVPGATPVPEAGKPDVTPVAATKPPSGWKPTAREEWAKLSPVIQEEVTRRERETAVALQEASEAKKGFQAYQSAVAPFEHMIRAEGGTAIQAIGSLLNTAAALRTAPPAHKAAIVANIIKSYGISVEQLAQALDGQAPTQGQQQQIDPAMIARQVEQSVLQRVQAQREQALHAKSAADVDSWAAGKEFVDDLRPTMASLMEAFAQGGQALSLDDAYKLAQNAPQHSDIAAIVKQREAAKQANASSASTQRARAAASSVRSQPAGVSTSPQPSSLREQLEATISDLSGR